MKVYVPAPLRSYTGGEAEVAISAPRLASLVLEMDRKYPGMRFRIIDEQDGIRPHIKLFVNSEQVHRLDIALHERDEIHIICALSGG
jgi:molybdopterin synthase sulfur carrier subunit